MLWTSARDLRTRPTKDKITDSCERVLVERLRQAGAVPAGGPAILAVMSPIQLIEARSRHRFRPPISLVVAEEGLAAGAKIGFDTHAYVPILSADAVAVEAARTAAGYEFRVTAKLAGEIRLVFSSAAEVEFLAQTFGAGGVDPMSATMAMVEAFAQDDQAAMLAAAADVDKLGAADVLESLSRFGQLIAKGVRPEDKDVMRAEIAAAGGDSVLHGAVLDIGTAMLVDANPDAAAAAFAAHAEALGSADGDALTALLGELMSATGRIVRRLDIKLNWKSADA
jgi:hypothetical protein